jgi:hypothetical protein
MTLGRLERVELRTVWNNEATDFTPWLAKPENLEALSEALGMDLESTGTEQSVGAYRADMLCTDAFSGNSVLIENQLEKTNHSHLGQILTYSAGLNVKTVIWIASRFTDEHRAALDFLNEITEEGVSFLGLKLNFGKLVIAFQRLSSTLFHVQIRGLKTFVKAHIKLVNSLKLRSNNLLTGVLLRNLWTLARVLLSVKMVRRNIG